MTNLDDLYQEMILDHNKSPRNFHAIPHPTHEAEGFNPLCGDHFHLSLTLAGDRIQEIGFEGSGCAISKASSSIMTTCVQGKSVQESLALFGTVLDMLTGKAPLSGKTAESRLAVFSGVSQFPTRVKCASLAWHTLKAALQGEKKTISTEAEEPTNGKN